jgi:biotin carboxylase
MGIVVLSRQHPSQARFDRWLGDAVKDAHLFTAPNRVDGFAAQGFAEIHAFDDYEDNGRVELEVRRLARRWPIERIVATSEADILRAGRLRSHLALPGQSGESALAFRDKLDMKRRLAGRVRRVAIPAFRGIAEPHDLLEFVDEHGLPAIVKPVDGFGSIGTTVLRTEADLERLLAHRLPRGLEIETFVAGAQYHVDGLVIDGELILCWPSRYMGDCLSFASGGITASLMLADDHPLKDRLCAAAAEILDLLPTPSSTTFHLELFHTDDDALVFCEIASRTGGVLINPVLQRAFGIDLNEAFVRAQAGVPVDVAALRRRARRPEQLFGWGCVPPRAGTFEAYRQAAPDLPWVVAYEWTMAPGTRSDGPTMSGDRVAAFVVELGELGDLGDDRLRAAWKWTTDNAIWAP